MEKNIEILKPDLKEIKSEVLKKFFSENPKMIEVYNNTFVGDYFMYTKNWRIGVYKIAKFEIQEQYHNIRLHCLRLNDAGEFDFEYRRINTSKTESYIDKSFFDFDFKEMKDVDFLSPSEYEQTAKEGLLLYEGKKDLSEYKAPDDFGNPNSIVGKMSSTFLAARGNQLEERKNQIQRVINNFTIRIEMQKASLDRIRDKMNEQIKLFNEQIETIQRVITVIELFLGIGEELHQMLFGEPDSGPIHLRQQTVYMDEEYRSWEDGGMDWSDITKFDEWLCKDRNFEKIIPEKKGMVTMVPRRYDKEYSGENWYYNAKQNEANLHTTYFLIRNGENLYRIHTDKMYVRPRLFPNIDELTKFFELADKTEKDKENFQFQYTKQALFMQGLLERTEVFKPLNNLAGTSVFNLESVTDEVLKFIYDAEENALTTGRPSWNEFIKSHGEIQHGDRIIWFQTFRKKEYYSDRLYKYYRSDSSYAMPESPEFGLYEVEKYRSPTWIYKITEDEAKQREKDFGFKFNGRMATGKVRRFSREVVYDYYYYHKDTKTDLTIMYQPGHENIWDDDLGDWRKPKNRTRFKIEPNEDALVNFDKFTIEDCDYYLHSRQDRHNYLHVMPALKFIRKHKKIEFDIEKEFAMMLLSVANSELKITMLFEEIMEYIQWWKLKNMIKRPLNKDDEKALRMIVKKIKSDKKK